MTNSPEHLTDREREVLACLVEGLANAEIAARLHLAPQTVRWYNSQIYSKLGVSNRREAVARAAAWGILGGDQRAEAVRNNLPAETTPFIGREKELRELAELLADAQVRLVTILGLGGMGKTRLALKLAERLAQSQGGSFEDGIFFVPLQSLAEPEHITGHIAASIGFRLTGDGPEPEQQLLEYLADRRMLLVMDNWEHLRAGSLLINDLLRAAPNLRILATSREKLNLSAETVYHIEGMILPTWETPDDALKSDAVQLMVQTAGRVKPGWRLEDSNLDDVQQVCRLTHGMPLGIVLAASWIDTLSLKGIVDELRRNIDFLASDMPDVPDRQRSIRAIFDYAWQQLGPDERHVFMRLSVFRGGFNRIAARVVAGSSARVLQALVHKALISRASTGRYEVHELLLQYAEEQLQQVEDDTSVRDAHGRYFLEWLISLEADIKGKRQVGALDEVEDDFENIRRAWSWAVEKNDFDLICQSAESVYLFCEMRSLFAEGHDLFAQALADVLDEANHAPVWSRLILCKHRLFEAPRPSDERSKAIQIAEQTANLGDMALGYLIKGRSKWIYQGDFEEALQFFTRAHDIYQEAGDEFYWAYAINRLGLCHASKGDINRGIELTQQSAELQRKIGDLSGLGISLNNLGAFTFLSGDYDDSTPLLRESIVVGGQSKNGGNLAFAYGMLSLVYFSGGEFAEAHELAAQASQLGQSIGYLQGASLGISTLGMLSSVAVGDYERGLQMSQEGVRLAAASNVSLQAWAQCGVALALCGLGEFQRLRAEIEELINQTWMSPTILGFVGAAWVVYCFEEQRYKQAVRTVSLVTNRENKTFQWTKQWSLLQDVQRDLRARIDDATFSKLWDEGRQLSLDDARQMALRDLA